MKIDICSIYSSYKMAKSVRHKKQSTHESEELTLVL